MSFPVAWKALGFLFYLLCFFLEVTLPLVFTQYILCQPNFNCIQSRNSMLLEQTPIQSDRMDHDLICSIYLTVAVTDSTDVWEISENPEMLVLDLLLRNTK